MFSLRSVRVIGPSAVAPASAFTSACIDECTNRAERGARRLLVERTAGVSKVQALRVPRDVVIGLYGSGRTTTEPPDEPAGRRARSHGAARVAAFYIILRVPARCQAVRIDPTARRTDNPRSR